MSDLAKKDAQRNKEKANKHNGVSTNADRLSGVKKSTFDPDKILRTDKPKDNSKGKSLG